MKKRFFSLLAIILGLTLLNPTGVYAATTVSGWYGGVQGGPQVTSSKDTGNGNGVVNNTPVAANGSHTLSKTGAAVGVFGGYGHLISNWYMAAQGQVDMGNFNRTHTGFLNGIFSTNKLHTHALWGLAAIVGYQPFMNIIPYVRLGGDFAQWHYKDSFLGNNNSSHWAFAPGLGIRAMLTKNIMVNAEYKYSFFRKMTVTNNGININTKPRVQTLIVGFAFKL